MNFSPLSLMSRSQVRDAARGNSAFDLGSPLLKVIGYISDPRDRKAAMVGATWMSIDGVLRPKRVSEWLDIMDALPVPDETINTWIESSGVGTNQVDERLITDLVGGVPWKTIGLAAAGIALGAGIVIATGGLGGGAVAATVSSIASSALSKGEQVAKEAVVQLRDTAVTKLGGLASRTVSDVTKLASPEVGSALAKFTGITGEGVASALDAEISSRIDGLTSSSKDYVTKMKDALRDAVIPAPSSLLLDLGSEEPADASFEPGVPISMDGGKTTIAANGATLAQFVLGHESLGRLLVDSAYFSEAEADATITLKRRDADQSTIDALNSLPGNTTVARFIGPSGMTHLYEYFDDPEEINKASLSASYDALVGRNPGTATFADSETGLYWKASEDDVTLNRRGDISDAAMRAKYVTSLDEALLDPLNSPVYGFNDLRSKSILTALRSSQQQTPSIASERIVKDGGVMTYKWLQQGDHDYVDLNLPIPGMGELKASLVISSTYSKYPNDPTPDWTSWTVHIMDPDGGDDGTKTYTGTFPPGLSTREKYYFEDAKRASYRDAVKGSFAISSLSYEATIERNQIQNQIAAVIGPFSSTIIEGMMGSALPSFSKLIGEARPITSIINEAPSDDVISVIEDNEREELEQVVSSFAESHSAAPNVFLAALRLDMTDANLIGGLGMLVPVLTTGRLVGMRMVPAFLKGVAWKSTTTGKVLSWAGLQLNRALSVGLVAQLIFDAVDASHWLYDFVKVFGRAGHATQEDEFDKAPLRDILFEDLEHTDPVSFDNSNLPPSITPSQPPSLEPPDAEEHHNDSSSGGSSQGWSRKFRDFIPPPETIATWIRVGRFILRILELLNAKRIFGPGTDIDSNRSHTPDLTNSLTNGYRVIYNHGAE